MRVWSCEQPRDYLWRLWAGPVGMALAFAALELASARWYGWRGLRESLQWWGAEAALVLIAAIPLFVTVRAVSLTDQHLIVRFYVGRIARFPWDGFKHASLFDIPVTNDGERRMLRMVPKNGRKVVLTDRMSNWESLTKEINARLTIPMSHRPTFTERILWPHRQKRN